MELKDRKKIKIAAIIIALIVLALSIFIGTKIIHFISDPDLFRNWIDSFGVFSSLAFIAVSLLQILIPFIPGEPMEIVAGYAFGAIEGTILCLISASIGSFAVISLVRKYGKRLVELFFDKEKIESLKFLKASNKNITLFSLIFIIPGTPKDLLCYFAGLTDIDIKSLLVITIFGRIPSIITSTFLGGSLGEQDYKMSIIVFSITAVLSLFGIILYNYLSAKKKRKS